MHEITNGMPILSSQNEQNLDKSNTEADDEMPIKPGIGIINLWNWNFKQDYWC